MRLQLIGATALAASLSFIPALAQQVDVRSVEITDLKAVYGRFEARDTVPARARLGGTVEELRVTEGDTVKAGEVLALIRDEKIAFQIASLDAQMRAVGSRLETAEGDLKRTEELVKRGVATVQRLDQLQSEVTVTRNQFAALEAQRSVLVKQEEEGAVLAPVEGKVLSVPVTRGAVVMGGEAIATIGGGGFFLRLSIPERHAGLLRDGAVLRIVTAGAETEGRLAKIYPQIENGRVTADVEFEKLDTAYVDARVLVEVPVGTRKAILIPQDAIVTRSGIDFVTVEHAGVEVEQSVVIGKTVMRDGKAEVEVLSGVSAGDRLVVK